MGAGEDDATELDSYRHRVDEHVRFSDTDALGHVNNVGVVAMVESGRVAFALDLLTRAGGRKADGAVDGLVLARLELDFRAELHYPARLTVGSRLLALGTSSLTVGTGVFEGERCVATSRGVLVLVGPDGAQPIPAPVRTALEAELP